MSYHCTCPMDRNEPTCPEHGHAWVWCSRELPIWSQLAWEMDLNWSADRGAHLLFWQHDHLPEWPFFFDTYTVAGTSVLRDKSQRGEWLTLDLLDQAHQSGHPVTSTAEVDRYERLAKGPW